MKFRINTDKQGRRFAFVGSYTVRETAAGTTDVLLDVDGDEVLIARADKWDDAIKSLPAVTA